VCGESLRGAAQCGCSHSVEPLPPVRNLAATGTSVVVGGHVCQTPQSSEGFDFPIELPFLLNPSINFLDLPGVAQRKE
jgi:hypothetical protein